MPVFHVKKRDNPYVQIDKTVFNDDRISWKSKGLLGYLLSKPHDWKTVIGDLVKRSPDGEYAVRSALRELMQYGYVEFKRVRDENGVFIDSVYFVYEIPHRDYPHVDNPDVDNPSVGNLPYSNNDISNNDITENDSAPKNGAGSEDDSIEAWFDERTPVIEKKEKLTVEERKARTAQAVQGAAERQQSGAPDLSWLNEEFVPLAVAFLRAAGRQYVPTTKERSLWRKVLREWVQIGIQPGHVRLAVDYMRKEDLTIGGIQSVTKIARDRMGDGQVERQQAIPKYRAS